MESTQETEAIVKMEKLQTALNALSDDKRKEFTDLMKDAQDENKSPAEAATQFEAFMASLPPSLRNQLQDGIVDVSNLTPEQLRGLVLKGAADGGIGELAFATRGNANNDWRSQVGEHEQGVYHPEDQAVTPGPGSSGVRQIDKSGPDLS